jgi:hypothetical protein
MQFFNVLPQLRAGLVVEHVLKLKVHDLPHHIGHQIIGLQAHPGG